MIIGYICIGLFIGLFSFCCVQLMILAFLNYSDSGLAWRAGKTYRNIKAQRELNTLKELVMDWHSGQITSDAAMTVVSMIVLPQTPSKECMEWGKKERKEYV